MSPEKKREPRRSSSETGGQDLRTWLAVALCGDREAYDRTVRHTQERVAGHLLGALRLPREQALELTEQTLLAALETVGEGKATESPPARLFGTARGRLRERLRATFGDIPGLDVPFDPEPDPRVLRAFYEADRRVDRQLAHRRSLPPFLELMHEGVQSLPALEREAIRIRWSLAGHGEVDPEQAATEVVDTLVGQFGIDRAEAARRVLGAPQELREVAGAVLVAHARPHACGVLDEHLRRAGWQPGRPFSDQLRQRVRHHIGACPTCPAGHQQAVQRIGSLPDLVLAVVLSLEEQRRGIMETVFAASSASGAATADGKPAATADDHRTEPVAATATGPAAAAAPIEPGRSRRSRRSRRRAAAAAAAAAAEVAPVGSAGDPRRHPATAEPAAAANVANVAAAGAAPVGSEGDPRQRPATAGSAAAVAGNAAAAAPARSQPDPRRGPPRPGAGSAAAAAAPVGTGPGPQRPPRRRAATAGTAGTAEAGPGRGGPGRRRGSRRRAAGVAAVVLAVLALGLTAWRWDSIGDREQVQLGVGSPSRGPASETAAPTTAATTAPRSSPPATTTATPTGTPSPSQQPSTADRTTPSPRPGTVPSTGASPTPAPAPALPTHRLVIHLSPLSTGAINVGIRGAAAGSCSDAGEDCAFSIRSGDRVTLDPVDVVPAWGPGPCAGTGAATECAFTATADNQLDLWVLRLAG